MKKIAILTGGGDCPGLNAVIRAVVKKASGEELFEVIGIEDGYDGMVHKKFKKLGYDDVSGILIEGGTILGTSKVANPYRYPIKKGKKLTFKDFSKAAIRNVKDAGVECLISVGGDGTLWIANKLNNDGIPVVGVPKTIDNDIIGTDITFGFDTACSIATEGVDRLHSTAQSHHRVMILEVMGHKAGWIALHAGVAGGGDIILIPEIPYSIDAVCEKVRQRNRRGRKFSIIVVAEGAKPKGGDVVIQRIVKESTDPIRLGGIGFVLGKKIEESTGIETRTVVMGHLQRGGTPTPFDRVLATALGTAAIDLIVKKRFGRMVNVRGQSISDIALKDVAQGTRTIQPDNPLLRSARSVGTCFGD